MASVITKPKHRVKCPPEAELHKGPRGGYFYMTRQQDGQLKRVNCDVSTATAQQKAAADARGVTASPRKPLARETATKLGPGMNKNKDVFDIYHSKPTELHPNGAYFYYRPHPKPNQTATQHIDLYKVGKYTAAAGWDVRTMLPAGTVVPDKPKKAAAAKKGLKGVPEGRVPYAVAGLPTGYPRLVVYSTNKGNWKVANADLGTVKKGPSPRKGAVVVPSVSAAIQAAAPQIQQTYAVPQAVAAPFIPASSSMVSVRPAPSFQPPASVNLPASYAAAPYVPAASQVYRPSVSVPSYQPSGSMVPFPVAVPGGTAVLRAASPPRATRTTSPRGGSRLSASAAAPQVSSTGVPVFRPSQ